MKNLIKKIKERKRSRELIGGLTLLTGGRKEITLSMEDFRKYLDAVETFPTPWNHHPTLTGGYMIGGCAVLLSPENKERFTKGRLKEIYRGRYDMTDEELDTLVDTVSEAVEAQDTLRFLEILSGLKRKPVYSPYAPLRRKLHKLLGWTS